MLEFGSCCNSESLPPKESLRKVFSILCAIQEALIDPSVGTVSERMKRMFQLQSVVLERQSGEMNTRYPQLVGRTVHRVMQEMECPDDFATHPAYDPQYDGIVCGEVNCMLAMLVVYWRTLIRKGRYDQLIGE